MEEREIAGTALLLPLPFDLAPGHRLAPARQGTEGPSSKETKPADSKITATRGGEPTKKMTHHPPGKAPSTPAPNQLADLMPLLSKVSKQPRGSSDAGRFPALRGHRIQQQRGMQGKQKNAGSKNFLISF